MHNAEHLLMHWRLSAQVLVGQNAIMATPAMSALIRRRKLYGAPCPLQWPHHLHAHRQSVL